MNTYRKVFKMYIKISSEEFTIKLDSITLRFENRVELSDILLFKSALNMAIAKIERSPVSQFKKTLLDLKMDVKLTIPNDIDDSIAYYVPGMDRIDFMIDRIRSYTEPVIIGLIIHELAHRFHHLYIKDGSMNEELIELYNKAIMGEFCNYSKKPEIGDPLTDLNVNEKGEEYRTVKNIKMVNPNNFVLKDIRIFRHFPEMTVAKSLYVYENSDGDTIEIDEADMSRIMKCPSIYARENSREFFAEMLTLITMYKVKPSQKLIAEKFLEIIRGSIKRRQRKRNQT